MTLAKPRNTLSRVVGGKAITEVNIAEAVKAHIEAQKPLKKPIRSSKDLRLPVPGPSQKKKKRGIAVPKSSKVAQTPGPSSNKRKAAPPPSVRQVMKVMLMKFTSFHLMACTINPSYLF